MKPTSKDVCAFCWVVIKTMAFKGSGACCELHRKALAGER